MKAVNFSHTFSSGEYSVISIMCARVSSLY